MDKKKLKTEDGLSADLEDERNQGRARKGTFGMEGGKERKQRRQMSKVAVTTYEQRELEVKEREEG